MFGGGRTYRFYRHIHLQKALYFLVSGKAKHVCEPEETLINQVDVNSQVPLSYLAVTEEHAHKTFIPPLPL